MNNALDLEGKTFGLLTVLYRSSYKHDRLYWWCRCKCGKEVEKNGSRLKDDPKRTVPLSCGCVRIYPGRKGVQADEMIGKPYGKLTIKAKGKKLQGHVYWICECACGNIVEIRLRSNKKNPSCGKCNKPAKKVKPEKVPTVPPAPKPAKVKTQQEPYRRVEIVKEKFGSLLVQEECTRSGTTRTFKCICDCGKEQVVSLDVLYRRRRQNINDCICPKSKVRQADNKIEVGQKYDRLVVEEQLPNDKNYNSVWRCRCECGQKVIRKGGHLRRGSAACEECTRKSKSEKLRAYASKLWAGETFGTWLVVRAVPNTPVRVWSCECVKCKCIREIRQDILGQKPPECKNCVPTEVYEYQDVTPVVRDLLTHEQLVRELIKRGWQICTVENRDGGIAILRIKRLLKS